MERDFPNGRSNFDQTKNYMNFIIIMFIVLAAVNVLVYLREFYSGLVMTFGLFLYLVVGAVYFNIKKAHALKALVEFAGTYASLQNRLIAEFDFPYFLIDKNLRLLWANKKTEELFFDHPQLIKQPVTEILSEIKKESLPVSNYESNVRVNFKDLKFRANIKLLSDDGTFSAYSFPDVDSSDLKTIYAVALFDETALSKYEKKYTDEMMVAGMLYLDNYEEALESVEEVSRTITTALIDRKINQYFSVYDCLVRKFEKDKYQLVMKAKSLVELGDDRFSIADEIKNINTESDTSITLSIGIGSNQGSYTSNLDAAKFCIDLALGRGGDQVVVKNGEGIKYYGGKTQAVEKNTKIKARVKAHTLHEFISVAENVVVMGHRMLDVDAFGAAVGIYLAAKSLNKQTHIVYDHNTISISPFLDLFRNNPEYDESLLVTCEQAKKLVTPRTLLVVVDTSKPSYTECEDLLYMTPNIVVMDHHRQSPDIISNAMLSYIEPYASSVCEMAAEVLQYFAEDIELSSSEADVIYAGIVVDTDNFIQRTGVRTFEAAAYLRKHGADVTRVRKMFREDMRAYIAKGEVIRNVKLFRDCFAISVSPVSDSMQPTVVGAQAANELLNIIGVKASFVLTQYNNTIYISARAIDEVNVQIIMERMGGGGHINIAGCQMEGASIKEAQDELMHVLSEMLDGGEL